jgi:hypothetical protein
MDYRTAMTNLNSRTAEYEASGDKDGLLLLEGLRNRLLQLGLGKQTLKLLVLQDYATAFGLGEVRLDADVCDRLRSRSPRRTEQAVDAVDLPTVQSGHESEVKSNEEGVFASLIEVAKPLLEAKPDAKLLAPWIKAALASRPETLVLHAYLSPTSPRHSALLRIVMIGSVIDLNTSAQYFKALSRAAYWAARYRGPVYFPHIQLAFPLAFFTLAAKMEGLYLKQFKKMCLELGLDTESFTKLECLIATTLPSRARTYESIELESLQPEPFGF